LPSNTNYIQLLAWNGGGNSNYTEIIAQGGYKAGSTVQDFEERVHDLVNHAEEIMHKELGAIYSEIKGAVAA
jgi:cerevisin